MQGIYTIRPIQPQVHALPTRLDVPPTTIIPTLANPLEVSRFIPAPVDTVATIKLSTSTRIRHTATHTATQHMSIRRINLHTSTVSTHHHLLSTIPTDTQMDHGIQAIQADSSTA